MLAGGRYDYLPSSFGYPHALPAIGWAAGIDRITDAVEYLTKLNMLKVKDGHISKDNVIGIVSYLSKEEISEYGN